MSRMINFILVALALTALYLMMWTYINWATSDENFCNRVSLDRRAEFKCPELLNGN